LVLNKLDIQQETSTELVETPEQYDRIFEWFLLSARSQSSLNVDLGVSFSELSSEAVSLFSNLRVILQSGIVYYFHNDAVARNKKVQTSKKNVRGIQNINGYEREIVDVHLPG
jgi:hypothetical protein